MYFKYRKYEYLLQWHIIITDDYCDIIIRAETICSWITVNWIFMFFVLKHFMDQTVQLFDHENDH